MTRPRLLSRRSPVRTLLEGASDWTTPLPETTTTPVVVDEVALAVAEEVVEVDSVVTEVAEADSVVDEEATEAVEEVAVVEVLLVEVPEPAVASPSPARR